MAPRKPVRYKYRRAGAAVAKPQVLEETHASLSFPHHNSRPQHGGRPRPLARTTGMKNEDFGKPIDCRGQLVHAKFVPGHVHLKDLGQLVAREIERAGGLAKEFNTIAVDDGDRHGARRHALQPAVAAAN